MSFDFGALEHLWLTSVEEVLTSIRLRRGERLYAIAFWLFYAETGAIILPPACGMDPEEARRSGESPERDARWEPYFERSIDAVIAVSRELTRRAHARIGVLATLPLTDDFVGVVCDPSWGDDGEKWLRRCVDEPLLSALFPNLS